MVSTKAWIKRKKKITTLAGFEPAMSSGTLPVEFWFTEECSTFAFNSLCRENGSMYEFVKTN